MNGARPGMMLGEATEAAVVALAAAGDDTAYSELVRRRQSAIRNLMRRLCRDAALADDLAQQTFLQAWRALRGLKSPTAFGGWLRKLAVNVWLQHERANRVEKASMQIVDTPESAPGFTASFTPTLSEKIDLDSALATLPSNVRICVVLAYNEGMSHSEISSVTAIPLGTVKSHVTRGSARLRELLRSYQHDIGVRHVR